VTSSDDLPPRSLTQLEILLEASGFVAGLHQDHPLRQVLEVRRILEASATALAAQRITDAETLA
jgi:GntR family transcriptional repressor for pyruvate dehydrogenase complex